MPEIICILGKIPQKTTLSDSLLRPAQSRFARELARMAIRQLPAALQQSWRLDESSPPKLLDTNGDFASGHVSLSHSGRWCACTLSLAGPAGIDIELKRPRDCLAALELITTQDERNWLAGQWPDAIERQLSVAWTLKEAIGKQHGAGWQTPASLLQLAPIRDKAPTDNRDLVAAQWHELAIGIAGPQNTLASMHCFLFDNGALSPIAFEILYITANS